MTSEHEDAVRVLRGQLERQEWDKAIVELTKLLQRVPGNLKLHLRLAHLYLKVGNTEKALERFRYCTQAYYERNEYKDALSAAASILKLEPDSEFALKMVRNAKAKLDFVAEVASHPLEEVLLKFLPPEALKELAASLQIFIYPECATVVEEGEPGYHFFLIRHGEVQLFLTDREGSKVRLAVFRDGDFFGEISLLTGGPRTATVVATKPSEFWVLGKPDFEGFIDKYPRFEELVHQYCKERIKDTLRRIRVQGIERRVFPRIPVELKVQAILLDDGGNPLGAGALPGDLHDLSLTGARLRVLLSHPEQWPKLGGARKARIVFDLTPGTSMSLACFLERAELKKLGREAYAEFGLSFGELSHEDNERINKFITRQLLSRSMGLI